MKTIVLPAGTEYVQFGELAHLIAIALHPLGDNPTDSEMMAYGGARINLDAELLQAVKADALPVKDPLTFGPHTFPIGDALNRALVPVDDLREFVAGRGLSILFQFTDYEAGTTSTSNMTQAERDEQQRDKHTRHAKGYYTMSEVAQILADTYSLDAAALLKTMKADYHAGNLTIRSRGTDAPVLPNHTLRDFYDWMFPDDIQAMLTGWKWKREFPFAALEAAPAQTATPAPVVVTDWRNAVRAEAWEKWVQTLAENGTPTLENVSVYLASWCDANQIMTDTGKTPKSSYLKIHVIDGKHWAPPRNMSREAAKKHLEQKEHAKQAN